MTSVTAYPIKPIPSRPRGVATSAVADACDGDNPFSAIANATSNRPFVIAQLGQSLDGRIATVTGESRWINGEAALDHLHRLRSLVDGIIVGAGTVVSDDPRLTVRRVAGKNPARIVIDPSCRIPSYARVFANDGSRRIVVTAAETSLGDNVETIVMPRANGKFLCRDIVERLFSLGLKRLLVEGGAATISSFIHADALDRLHVLIAPIILGSGKPCLELPPVRCLAEARRPATRIFEFAGGDILFDCDMRMGSA